MREMSLLVVAADGPTVRPISKIDEVPDQRGQVSGSGRLGFARFPLVHDRNRHLYGRLKPYTETWGLTNRFVEAISSPRISLNGSSVVPPAMNDSKFSKTDATTIVEHEIQQVERANATGRPPVVFIHGLWLLPSSWDRWAKVFEDAGYTALTPGWPDDPETVEEANANPEVFAKKSIAEVAEHFEQIIRGLKKKPALVGHSFGGLIAQILAGRGLAAVTVAIDPAPFRGVLPLPISTLKSAWPVLHKPSNRNRAVPLTFDQFRYAFGNAVSEDEAKELYEKFAVPASGKPLFQSGAANLNPWTAAKVEKNTDRE